MKVACQDVPHDDCSGCSRHLKITTRSSTNLTPPNFLTTPFTLTRIMASRKKTLLKVQLLGLRKEAVADRLQGYHPRRQRRWQDVPHEPIRTSASPVRGRYRSSSIDDSCYPIGQ